MDINTNTFIKAIAAGFCIGLAAIANWIITNPVIGAFIFSFGLLMVVQHNMKLVTGVMGIVNYSHIDSFKYLAFIWLGNLVGILIAALGMLFMGEGILSAVFINLNLQKLQLTMNSFYSFAARAFFCGSLIHAGVQSYKKGNTLLLVLSVMLFVLCGFEHCVVNIIPLIFNFSWNALIVYVINVFYNAIGAKFMAFILEKSN